MLLVAGNGYHVFEDKVRLVDACAGTLMASQVIDYIAARGSVAPRGGKTAAVG